MKKKMWFIVHLVNIWVSTQRTCYILKALETVPNQFHKLPFHSWIYNNTPVNALTEKTNEMIWHQRIINLSSGTILEAYKYVDGVLNLSRFDFDNITKCTTCTKDNLCKNSLIKQSLSEMVPYPYQYLFIDFGFLGRILYDKEEKLIPSRREDIEGITGEMA